MDSVMLSVFNLQVNVVDFQYDNVVNRRLMTIAVLSHTIMYKYTIHAVISLIYIILSYF